MPKARTNNRAKEPERALNDGARALLEGVITSLAAAGTKELRAAIFPNGVHTIEIALEIDTANAMVRIEGASVQGMVLRTVQPPEPESCREALRAGDELTLGQRVPNQSEETVSGAITKRIKRTDPEFANLVKSENTNIVFKDEEETGADRMMTATLRTRLNSLADAVSKEWSGYKLRVTEAWDEDDEHTGNSLHYEGRAADVTTHPVDASKLGRLGRLSVDAGFDWVWYENSAHIHVSVKA